MRILAGTCGRSAGEILLDGRPVEILVVVSSEFPEVLRLSHRTAAMCEGRLTGVLPAGAARSSGAQQRLLALAGLVALVVASSLASPNVLQTSDVLGVLAAVGPARPPGSAPALKRSVRDGLEAGGITQNPVGVGCETVKAAVEAAGGTGGAAEGRHRLPRVRHVRHRRPRGAAVLYGWGAAVGRGARAPALPRAPSKP